MAAAESVRIGLCQVEVGEDKEANLIGAEEAVREAHRQGAELVMLPECFNCPYDVLAFGPYAEEVPGVGAGAGDADPERSPTFLRMSALAAELGVYLVGGSVPERGEGGALFNTSVVYGPGGGVVAKHRKAHLFDIDVPGQITFRESDTLTAGGGLTVFDAGRFGRMALGICYDMRFPELAAACAAEGARVLLYPGAFNTTTGPVHWHLLQRARAVDYQVFVATCSPARNPASSYQAWGHSTVVDPWGDTVVTCGHEPAVRVATVDLARVAEVRGRVPVWRQRRNDLYTSPKLLKRTGVAGGGGAVRAGVLGAAACAAVGAAALAWWRKK